MNIHLKMNNLQSPHTMQDSASPPPTLHPSYEPPFFVSKLSLKFGKHCSEQPWSSLYFYIWKESFSSLSIKSHVQTWGFLFRFKSIRWDFILLLFPGFSDSSCRGASNVFRAVESLVLKRNIQTYQMIIWKDDTYLHK